MKIKSFTEFQNTHESLINEDNMEGAMYKVKIGELIEMATEIENLITDDEELDSWVKDKITIAHHNMDAILRYKKSKKFS
jgi:hypothetical protein